VVAKKYGDSRGGSMGQYWKLVNVDKKEFVLPHALGCGLKLWEQLANHPSTGTALLVLLAAMPEQRGGGDFDLEENWHGPERVFPEHSVSPGPMPEEYAAIAKRTIGRWCGDRIILIGDYAEDSDAPWSPVPASQLYSLCASARALAEDPEYYAEKGLTPDKLFTDISADVAAVIEHELHGKFIGNGWKQWVGDKS
jgi:hypothetical protein